MLAHAEWGQWRPAGMQSCMSRSLPNFHLDGFSAVSFAFFSFSLSLSLLIDHVGNCTDYGEYNQFTSTQTTLEQPWETPIFFQVLSPSFYSGFPLSIVFKHIRSGFLRVWVIPCKLATMNYTPSIWRDAFFPRLLKLGNLFSFIQTNRAKPSTAGGALRLSDRQNPSEIYGNRNTSSFSWWLHS